MRQEDMMYVEIENDFSLSMIRDSKPKNDEFTITVNSDQLNMRPVHETAEDIIDIIEQRKDEILNDPDFWSDENPGVVEGYRKAFVDERAGRGSNLADFSQAYLSVEFINTDEEIREAPKYQEYMAVVRDIVNELEAHFDFSMVDKSIKDSPWELYECGKCDHKHQQTSKIGKKHKKYEV